MKPSKAISLERDRAQSQIIAALISGSLLLLTVARLLTGSWLLTGAAHSHLATPSVLPLTLPLAPWLGWSAAVSLLFAFTVWRLRAATPAAAALGALICFDVLLVQADGRSWLETAMPALLALFVSTFAATRVGRRRKETLGTAEARHGRRASQIAANLGIAGLCAVCLAFAVSPGKTAFASGFGHAAFAACLAALVEATADTLSSELGPVFGGEARLITTGQIVPAGTDGGITLAGTACGVAGALLLLLVTAAAWRTSGTPVGWPLLAIATASGIAGLIFDSLLGATLERKGWIGNDAVNLLSTIFAATVAYRLVLFLPRL